MIGEFQFAGFDLDALIERAIALLKQNQPDEHPYHLAFSGGKDSIVLKHLAVLAEVEFRAIYNVTTIDPPELVQYIRKQHPDVVFDHPRKNFFREILTTGFPIRQSRWCCRVFKESRTANDAIQLVGVRAEESAARESRWKLVGPNHRGVMTIAPMLHWRGCDVWEFIERFNLPYCELYEDFDRLGCVACPFKSAAQKRVELERWPGFKRAYLKAFRGLWEKRAGKLDRKGNEWFGSRYFKSSEELFWWWIDRGPTHKPDGSIAFYEQDWEEND